MHSFFGFLTGVTTAAGAGYMILTDDISAVQLSVQQNVISLRQDVAAVSLRTCVLMAADVWRCGCGRVCVCACVDVDGWCWWTGAALGLLVWMLLARPSEGM